MDFDDFKEFASLEIFSLKKTQLFLLSQELDFLV